MYVCVLTVSANAARPWMDFLKNSQSIVFLTLLEEISRLNAPHSSTGSISANASLATVRNFVGYTVGLL